MQSNLFKIDLIDYSYIDIITQTTSAITDTDIVNQIMNSNNKNYNSDSSDKDNTDIAVEIPKRNY